MRLRGLCCDGGEEEGADCVGGERRVDGLVDWLFMMGKVHDVASSGAIQQSATSCRQQDSRGYGSDEGEAKKEGKPWG